MGLSRLATAVVVIALVAFVCPAPVSAGFDDEPLFLDRLEPAQYRHISTDDPNVNRLFFMPTFETPPQGQAAIGTTELVTIHGSVSPFDFVQIGGAIVPWLPGVASLGAKVRVWRSHDQHAGIAVGGNYTSLNVGVGSNDFGEATTGYIVTGYSNDRGQVQVGLFFLETQEDHYVNFIPPPEPDYSRHNNSKTERRFFGVLGLSTPVHGTTSAILELWGIGDNNNWPVAFPGFRFSENNTSFEAILAPVNFDDGEFQVGVPIFNITHHFR